MFYFHQNSNSFIQTVNEELREGGGGGGGGATRKVNYVIIADSRLQIIKSKRHSAMVYKDSQIICEFLEIILDEK